MLQTPFKRAAWTLTRLYVKYRPTRKWGHSLWAFSDLHASLQTKVARNTLVYTQGYWSPSTLSLRFYCILGSISFLLSTNKKIMIMSYKACPRFKIHSNLVITGFVIVKSPKSLNVNTSSKVTVLILNPLWFHHIHFKESGTTTNFPSIKPKCSTDSSRSSPSLRPPNSLPLSS